MQSISIGQNRASEKKENKKKRKKPDFSLCIQYYYYAIDDDRDKKKSSSVTLTSHAFVKNKKTMFIFIQRRRACYFFSPALFWIAMYIFRKAITYKLFSAMAIRHPCFPPFFSGALQGEAPTRINLYSHIKKRVGTDDNLIRLYQRQQRDLLLCFATSYTHTHMVLFHQQHSSSYRQFD
jgi:hypothetical protein